MLRYRKNSEWTKIHSNLRSINGYIIDPKYSLVMINNAFKLRVKEDGFHTGYYTAISIEATNTSFCCGVMQLGFFGEHHEANSIPDNVLKEMWKVIVSWCKINHRKGMINGYFFKRKGYKVFENPVIEKMFVLGGAEQVGKVTYNPNSGNRIKSYLYSID